MDIQHKHDINTGVIFRDLTYDMEKYPDRLFSEMADRLEFILIRNNIIPMPFEMGGDKISSTQYKTNIILSYKNDGEFDFFFALKLLCTDEMQIREFLIYQLKTNFNYTLKDYTEFLEDLLVKYSTILQNNKIDVIVNKFITNSLINTGVPKILISDIKNESLENPYPTIFIALRGYKIFEAFKKGIITDATEYADYSYLFGVLKKDELIHEMKHQKFIDFLWCTYKVKFASNYNQLKYYENAVTEKKKRAYSYYKKQFQ